jgi:hypothetical protein
MIYFKRFLWLSAWSVWLWLGFGLYRELPRHAGPVLTQIPIQGGEQILGLFADGDLLATIRVGEEPRTFLVSVWDVSRAEEIRQSILSADDVWRYHFSSRHGVIIGGIPNQASGDPARIGALDLHTGKWTNLAANGAQLAQFHPAKPLVVLRMFGPERGSPEAIVVDFRTGRHVFEWKRTESAKQVTGVDAMPVFLPRSDSLLVPVFTRNSDPPDWSHRFEVWKIEGSTTQADQVFDGLKLSTEASVSPTGRFAWTELDTEPKSTRVFDAEQGGVVAILPPDTKRRDDWNNEDRIKRAMFPEANLGIDGKTVFFSETLWDVERRVPIWTPHEFESTYVSRASSTITVQEWWPTLLDEWVIDVTWAVRDFRTSGVLFRVWQDDGSTFRFDDRQYNSETRGICIDDKGAIRWYPPPPNYPLLFLCQTILALPLILLWAVLRWRRKRRALSAAPA